MTLPTPLWAALIAAAVGCYLLKLAGLSLPASVLGHPRVQLVAGYLPLAMLAALVAVDLFTDADDSGAIAYGLDWRVCVGVAAGAVALLLRAGFLVVFVIAVAVTALLRLL